MSLPTAVAPGASLDLDAIETMLLAQRQAQKATSRAMTLNLIVPAADDRDAHAVAIQLASLSRRHPGRALLLVPQAGEGNAWTARILPVAELLQERVCSEIVQLEAGRAALAFAASAVSPLLHGGLPVFLWWRGAPPWESAPFQNLVPIADRILLDGDDLDFDATAYRRLAAWQATLRPGCALSDLVWARLTPWRRLLAQATDLAHLDQLEQVTLTSCCGQRVLNGASLLLAGWFMSVLGWEIDGAPAAETLHLRHGAGHGIHMRFNCDPEGERAGLLQRVSLRTRGEVAAVEVARQGSHLRVAVQRGGVPVGTSAGDFPVMDAVAALREELAIAGPDAHFQAALHAAAAIAAALEPSPL